MDPMGPNRSAGGWIRERTRSGYADKSPTGAFRSNTYKPECSCTVSMKWKIGICKTPGRLIQPAPSKRKRRISYSYFFPSCANVITRGYSKVQNTSPGIASKQSFAACIARASCTRNSYSAFSSNESFSITAVVAIMSKSE